MAIQISENIKRLRHSRELTQEALAEILGVSSQSVSKWECGDNYPDIEILPAIANFFEITLDELLGMSAIRDEKRYGDALVQTDELLKESVVNNAAEVITLWTELARDMPNNWKVQYTYAEKFSMVGNGGVSHGTYEQNVAHKRKIIPVYERILENCGDFDMQINTIAALCRVYSELREFDKAAEYANRLTPTAFSRERMNEEIAMQRVYSKITTREQLENADSGELLKLLEPVEYALANHSSLAHTSLSNLRNLKKFCGLLTGEEYVELLKFDETWAKLQNYLYPPTNLISIFYTQMTSAYLEIADYENALDYFEKSVGENIKIPWSEPAQQITFENDDDGTPVQKTSYIPARRMLYNRYEQDSAFTPLRDNPRYVAAMAKLLEGGE
ncbi:MAG: helix-turn-helix domain-containing protein [Oscillospiraceae bacterium]|jgi:transcriptional regulator with XRE-family HTH domain|nr:helix-turn-helix domain-containing protein [Oscillospiraceae bacterium]